MLQKLRTSRRATTLRGTFCRSSRVPCRSTCPSGLSMTTSCGKAPRGSTEWLSWAARWGCWHVATRPMMTSRSMIVDQAQGGASAKRPSQRQPRQPSQRQPSERQPSQRQPRQRQPSQSAAERRFADLLRRSVAAVAARAFSVSLPLHSTRAQPAWRRSLPCSVWGTVGRRSAPKQKRRCCWKRLLWRSVLLRGFPRAQRVA